MRQEVSNPEPAVANRVVLGELTRVTSIELKLDAAACAGLDADDPRSAELCGREGVMAYCLGDFREIFEGVAMDVVPVHSRPAPCSAGRGDVGPLGEQRGMDGSRTLGAFNADPLGVPCAMRSPRALGCGHGTDGRPCSLDGIPPSQGDLSSGLDRGLPSRRFGFGPGPRICDGDGG